MYRILLIDDEPNIAWLFQESFGSFFDFQCFQNASGALACLAKESFDLVLLDLCLENQDGLAVLEEIKKIDPFVPVIIMTAYASVQTAVEAMKKGACDYVSKPFKLEQIKGLITKVLYEKKNEPKIPEGLEKHGIVAVSKKMLAVLETITKISATGASVLITGETGTGKELVARAIHAESARKKGPFLALNCAAVPEALLESELFGYEPGAFTGAKKVKPGKIELAHKGTLLLDELGDMPLSTQAKLLRVIEEREVERLGSVRKIPVDVRFLASTNKDLAKAIKAGLFREDLYFRLAVLPLELPPLRERAEDIPVLVDYFLRIYMQKYKKEIRSIREDALQCLQEYYWPGNVRELKNVVEQMVVMAAFDILSIVDIPAHIRRSGLFFEKKLGEERTFFVSQGIEVKAKNIVDPSTQEEQLDLKMMRKEAELQAIKLALKKCGGNRTRAAKLLGISRRSFQYKLRELGKESSLC